jgi:hypothetical protein
MSEKIEINYEEKYKRYRENVKKANLKFIDTHRDIVNQRAREYYQKKVSTDEAYLEKRRAANKRGYLKRQEKIKQSNIEAEQNVGIDNSPKITLAI